MNEQDKKISRLYKETYGNIHASEDLKGKVINMTNKKQILEFLKFMKRNQIAQ